MATFLKVASRLKVATKRHKRRKKVILMTATDDSLPWKSEKPGYCNV